jgi:hypothetical protein
MSTRGMLAAVAVMLAGCSQDPRALWVGRYDAFVTDENWICGAEGDPPLVTTDRITLEIEQDGESLYIAGRCRIPLFDVTDESATIGVSTCRGVLWGDGYVVDIETLGGAAALRFDDIAIQWDLRIVFEDGSCQVAHAEINGTRI